MSAESSLYSLLSGNGGVTALVSTRIYPDAMPEKTTYPAIVFARIGTEPLVLVHGASGYADMEFSIGCWGETRAAADAVASAVQTACATSTFSITGREAGFDPETGLVATTLSATVFAAI